MSRSAVHESIPSPALGDAKEAHSWLENRLQVVVLLSGSVGRRRLGATVQRSILDLPLDNSSTVLDHWIEQVGSLATNLARPGLVLRVMTNARAVAPGARVSDQSGPSRLEIKTDAADYRGTAGVLKDLSQAYDDDGLILVANGAQILSEDLSDLAVLLARRRSDVSLVSHDDGTPSGLMLLRCGVLKTIPDVGFVDMKEQALPQIALHHHVAVVRRSQPSSLPIRGLGDYIAALRMHHSRSTGQGSMINAFTEDWKPTFSIIEPQAQVDPSAHVHDSVVLRGATVRRSAVLVRSVVGPGGVVSAGQTLANRLVTAQNRDRKKG